MRFLFTEKQIADEDNKFEIEDFIFTAQSIEGEGKLYTMVGSAVIDGETYTDFHVEFETTEQPAVDSLDAILSLEWEWYDFLL